MSITIDPSDTEYQESTLTEVEQSEDGRWTLVHDGWAISTKDECECGYEPQVGDTLRCYGRGFGHVVRGITVNGHVFRYETEEQYEVRRLRELEEKEAADRAEFEEKREEYDRRFDALPPAFQKRIARRRRNNPDFRWRYESYELFVCEEAVKFVDAAAAARLSLEYHQEVNAFWADDAKRQNAGFHSDPPDDFIAQFLGWASALNSAAYDYDYERQQKVLGCSDQHSGNTFGMAMRLAFLYADGNYEGVDKQFGALSPLVGSEEYGDIDTEVEADAPVES